MSRKKSIGIFTLLFVVVFLTAFLAFFIQGKSFVWKSDGFRQYYPALHYLGSYYRAILKNLLSGNLSLPMIDYTIGQGEDILTTFANYGLGDPLTLLCTFVPGDADMEYLYGFLVVLRLYLSGITFLVYCEGMGLHRKYSICGALVYVFCGFALWSVKDPFFLNAMIYLPLVLLGVEYVQKKKSPLLLAFSVFFSVMSGYYFFYMTVICAVCYFVARSAMRYGKHLKQAVLDGVKCLLVALGGVFLSGALLLPCVYGFMKSSRTEAYVSLRELLVYDLEYYKKIILHLFSVTENDDAGAVGYLSMAVVLLIVLVILAAKKEKKYRVLKICTALSFLAVASPFAGYAMNGFGYITNRFMFIPAFLMALILVLIMPDLFVMETAKKRGVICVCAIYALLCVLFTDREGMLQTGIMLLLLLGTILCLCLIRNKKRMEQAVCGILLLNLIVNGNLMYSGYGAGMADAYMDAGSVTDAYDNEDIAGSERISRGELSRVDDMLDGGENPNRSAALTYGYCGISVYYSVINSCYAEFMESMENAPDLMYTHRVLGNDGRTILENLSNVLCVVSDEKALVPYGYEKVVSPFTGDGVYENKTDTSVGYTYDRYVTEEEYDAASVFDRQNILLEAAVPEKGSALASELGTNSRIEKGQMSGEWNSLAFDMTDVRHFDWKNGRLRVKKKNGTFSVSLRRKQGYEYYLRLSGLKLKESSKNTAWANVTLGELSKSFLISDESYDFYFGRENYLVCLGTPEEDNKEETMVFRINGPAQYELEDIELVEVPVSGVAQKVEALNRESLKQVKVSGNSVSGSLKLSEEKILCLAIPYKEGYTLLVDGEETKISKVNKMYMGAVVKEGEHSILLKYVTPGFKAGIILTVIGTVYILFLWILYKKHCVKQRDVI